MPQLKREIGFATLLFLAINAIIGTGIFFVPSIAAGIAGPASIISWIIVGVISIIIALCFAELSNSYPKCGGVYEYAKEAFGEETGFIVGWLGWLIANVTIAMLVVGSFSYLKELISISPTLQIVLALIFVIGMNLINIKGINMSIKTMLFFAGATILALWILISWGAYTIDLSQLSGIFMWPSSKIFLAMVFILETFFGWETISYLSEETKDPKQNIPRALIFGTIAVVLFAIGIIIIVLGVLPWQTVAASEAPLTLAAANFMPPVVIKFVAILIFLNIMGGAAAWIITTPRLIFAMGRDGMLPKSLNKIHPKFGTPINAIILQTFLTSAILLSGSYLFLLKILLPLAILMYIFGAILPVVKLRLKYPKSKRDYKVPFGKILPILIAGILFLLLFQLELDVIMMSILFIILGIPLLILMKFRHSETFPHLFYSFITRLPGYDLLSRSSYDKSISNRMIHGLNVKGKVLEVDCKTSLFFRDTKNKFNTALKVGSDLSFAPLIRAKNKNKDVHFINADTSDLPFKDNSFDFVFCMGLSPQVVDLDSFIKEIIRVLKPEGTGRILAFTNVLGFESFYSPQVFRNTVEKHGFRAVIERERYGGVSYDFITISDFKGFFENL